MHAYPETELLRLAQVRTDRLTAQRWLDIAEANRLATKARSEAIQAALRAAGRALGRLAGRIAAWRRHQIAVAELQALDARMLGDIGISRDDIPRVAAGLWMPETRETRTMSTLAMPGNENARQAAA
jgi:uncharacterized protein YjiS (DUF1127 family)